MAYVCDFTDQLDVAASLGDLLEAKILENGQDITAGKPTKLGVGETGTFYISIRCDEELARGWTVTVIV